MKIKDVRNIFVDHYLFVEIETDTGIVGLGESGAWGFLEASAAVVEKFKHYLIGQDPLTIEHHWQYMYRSFHFRGAAVMGALSAIDIALWDITGKHHGVPVYALLGGPCRHKARVYYHVFGETTEELVAGCLEAKRQGFTAIGHLTPFLDMPRHRLAPSETYAKKIADAADRVRQYRESSAVGGIMARSRGGLKVVFDMPNGPKISRRQNVSSGSPAIRSSAMPLPRQEGYTHPYTGPFGSVMTIS